MLGHAVQRVEKERASCCTDSPFTSGVTGFRQDHPEEVCGILLYGLTVGCGIVVVTTHLKDLMEKPLSR
jgi:hypothetical protein